MPGLHAFKRRWDVGSDDFVFPGIIDVIFRLIGLTVIAAVYGSHKEDFADCDSGHLIQRYYIGAMILLSANVVCSCILSHQSMQGTIVCVQKRKHITKILYVKIGVLIPEVIWLFIGTYWAFPHQINCKNHIVIGTVQALVVFGWITFISMLLGIIFVFDPFGHKIPSDSVRNASIIRADSVHRRESSTAKLWETRLRFIFCFASRDANISNAFDEVANLLAYFFKGIDLVPTDIAAGVILVRAGQQKRKFTNKLKLSKLEKRNENGFQDNIQGRTSTSKNICSASALNTELETIDPLPWMSIQNAAHFMKYALAVYGWPFYLYENKVFGCCKLISNQRCCRAHPNVFMDGYCHVDMASISASIGVNDEDIIFAAFSNAIYETPFMVVRDPTHSAIVIAIRGTRSLEDALTDLTAEGEDIEVEGVGPQCKAHKGMIRCAKYIRSVIKERGILESATRSNPNYEVFVTGHSLGAGTAVVLSLMLRLDFPNLKCFAFSPPEGLLSLPLALHTQSFVCSVVLGDDFIARLGIGTMEDLKLKILSCIKESRLPKYKILAGVLCESLGSQGGENDEIDSSINRPLVSINRQLHSYGSQEHTNLEKSIDDAINESHETQIRNEPLHLPGQIMYISREKEGSCFDEAIFKASWARRDIFMEIVVSTNMVLDHMPYNVSRALDQLAENNYVITEILEKSENVSDNDFQSV